ncbi:MAG: DUF6488 family protein [Cellvibrio sp.]|uniref:DUF6488 family protein n=1 Tax=Cellvibrio sp. TaxID=1965322 RepID=UPI0031B24330
MKNLLSASLLSAMLLGVLSSSPAVLAHEGHDHSYVTETKAITIGRDTTTHFTQNDPGFGFGKLPASWRDLPIANARLLKNGDGYYIVTVTNEAEKKTLFLLMTSNGDVYGANFTGEFEQLKHDNNHGHH